MLRFGQDLTCKDLSIPFIGGEINGEIGLGKYDMAGQRGVAELPLKEKDAMKTEDKNCISTAGS